MEIGKEIKEAREKAGMSREELALRLGVSYWTIAKYETGERTPDAPMLKKISKVLKVSIDHLVGNIPQQDSKSIENKTNNDLEVFLRAIGKLSPEAKKKVYDYIEMVDAIEKQKKKKKK